MENGNMKVLFGFSNHHISEKNLKKNHQFFELSSSRIANSIDGCFIFFSKCASLKVFGKAKKIDFHFLFVARFSSIAFWVITT
jgi:hypothetical protein